MNKKRDRDYYAEFDELQKILINICERFGYYEGMMKSKAENYTKGKTTITTRGESKDVPTAYVNGVAFDENELWILAKSATDMVIIDLYSFFYKGDMHTICLSQLLELLKQEVDSGNRKVSSVISWGRIMRCKLDIDKVNNEIGKLKTYRNEVLAHKDTNYKKRHKVLVKDITTCINHAMTLLKDISDHLGFECIDFKEVMNKKEIRGKTLVEKLATTSKFI